MKNFTLRHALVLLSLGLGSGLLAAGCGGASIANICDLLCTCKPCTNADRAKCEADGEDARQAADSAGCGGVFDDALSCFQDNASCKDSNAAEKACADQFKALSTCDKGGGGGLGLIDPCTIATDRLSTCLNVTTSGSSSGGTIDCSGSTLCTAQCINAASCDSIKDAFTGMPTSLSKPFLDCVTKCSNGS